MLSQLQAQGMLRREKNPDFQLVRELLATTAARLCCKECGSAGLEIGDDWEDDWTDEARCGSCQRIIPAERLEIFPEAELCSDCQSKRESGRLATDDAEYCGFCGGLMKLHARRGAGVAGYRMVCRDCGR